MSEPKFTPKPWTTDGRFVRSSSFVIAEVERWKTPTEPIVEATANGHLIASAPDLYEACDELIAWADRNNTLNLSGKLRQAVISARAALSKARGE